MYKLLVFVLKQAFYIYKLLFSLFHSQCITLLVIITIFFNRSTNWKFNI